MLWNLSKSLFVSYISGKQAYRGADGIYRLFTFYALTLGGNTGFCGIDYRVVKCVKWSWKDNTIVGYWSHNTVSLPDGHLKADKVLNNSHA